MLPEIPLENINKKTTDTMENEHLHFTYCIRKLYLDYIKNSYSTVIKQIILLTVDNGFKWTFLKGRYIQMTNKEISLT